MWVVNTDEGVHVTGRASVRIFTDQTFPTDTVDVVISAWMVVTLTILPRPCI